MIHKDDGGGITERSLSFWKQKKDYIGRVVKVEAHQDCLYREKQYSGPGIEHFLEWNLRITGSKGSILLSGCNCGYGGEGPNGTRRILMELGIEYSKAEELMRKHDFSIPIPACPICQLYGEVEGGDLVDYGSTRVRTPIYYGCKDGWDQDGEPKIDLSNCPYFKELPFCKIHPTTHVEPKSGCPKCVEEYFENNPGAEDNS